MEAQFEKTDEMIAAEVQGGDADSFGVLIERYEMKLSRYAHRFFADEDEAKDAVQETFIRAYTNIQSFDVSRKFSPWIYRIAHNTFINNIKKKSGREFLSFFEFDTLLPHLVSGDSTEDTMSHREVVHALEKELQAIDVKYREPLILYYFEELNYKEIADILHIPVATVGVRLKRGREYLKRRIESFS